MCRLLTAFFGRPLLTSVILHSVERLIIDGAGAAKQKEREICLNRRGLSAFSHNRFAFSLLGAFISL